MSARSPLGKIREGLSSALAKLSVANGFTLDLTVLTGMATEDRLIERAPAAALECGTSAQEIGLDKAARVTTPWTVYATIKNSSAVDPEVLGLDLADDLADVIMRDFRQSGSCTLTTVNSSVLGYIDEQRSIVAVMLEIQTIHHIQYA